ncbi:hypothetical protein GCM10009613_40360 [Pseudonocardia kongjuensis]|uniref:Acyl-CoA dehydrogenase/oxidase C-terminal domain-containing protein n=1 Tax=Pseudonocardia kongjuensis TaxID=102227 RepID=A0ABP4IM46_9PSEU
MNARNVDPMLADTIDSVLGDRRGRPADGRGATSFDRELWTSLTDLGFARLTTPETSGGSGAGGPAGAYLARRLAFHALDVPQVEHDLLAGWLLDRTGLPPAGDGGVDTVCVLDDDGRGIAPYGAVADRVVLVRPDGDGWRVAVAAPADLVLGHGTNPAGEPRSAVVATGPVHGVPVDRRLVEDLLLRGALARAAQICGALERAVELSIQHAGTREQFGRRLADFQAVQALIIDAAAETALALAAVDGAVDLAGAADPGLPFAVAVARSCTGHAASVVTRNAHQVHGAIGTTAEHDLHRSTTRALAWRNDYGHLHGWDDAVTTMAARAGDRALWPLLLFHLGGPVRGWAPGLVPGSEAGPFSVPASAGPTGPVGRAGGDTAAGPADLGDPVGPDDRDGTGPGEPAGPASARAAHAGLREPAGPAPSRSRPSRT